MKKDMYGKMVALFLALVQVTALSGCTKENAVNESTSSSLFEPIEDTGTDKTQDTPASEIQTKNVQEEVHATESEPEKEESSLTSRKDGERFEETITLEGMEETVMYEHVLSSALGFEIDYDYESLVRKSEPDRERFISVYDDPEHPDNYLDIKYVSENVEATLASVTDDLSNDYEIITEEYVLDNAGSCTRVDASEAKGGGTPDQMQMVYIIPAGDGAIVGTAHYGFEAAEGFGRRFSYVMNTLVVIPRNTAGTITDEQALLAIQKYCYINNPDLENIVNEGECQVYWDVSTGDAGEIVVLFRSYTGALIRYYIDPATGDTYVTEFVQGITDDEERTDETFNVKDYMD